MNHLKASRALSVAAIIIFNGCVSQKADDTKYETIHYNVVIAPDLSNRVDPKLHNKPVSDTEILDVILDDIPLILNNNGRKTHQQDKFRVDFINKKLINTYEVNTAGLSIDFSKFGTNQEQRINYVKGIKQKSLLNDTETFKHEFTRVEDLAKSETYGADIWSYFNDQIDGNVVDLKQDVISFNNANYTNKYRNILVLLTDGYIEAGLEGKDACQGNRCYYLSSQRIKEFRTAFLKSGEKDMKNFFAKKEYGIVPVENNSLKDLEVLVLELYDRSLSKGGNATVIPKDKEIIELFWHDWLTKSGVKKYELNFTASSKEQITQVIKRFLDVNQ